MRPELSTWKPVVNNFSSPFGTFGPFDEHFCPSGGKTRTAQNTDGSDLHLLSAESIGHILADPTLRRETSSQGPVLFVLSGRLCEGYVDDAFRECFGPLLIDRIAFGSPHPR